MLATASFIQEAGLAIRSEFLLVRDGCIRQGWTLIPKGEELPLAVATAMVTHKDPSEIGEITMLEHDDDLGFALREFLDHIVKPINTNPQP